MVCYNRGHKGVRLSRATQELPRTLGALRQSSFSEAKLANRSVKDELRNNLICKIQRGEELFPGILGYEDTVVPQVVNAILSRHNFILLGLRGQAKTRLIRMLTTLLDEITPYVEGCEIHDNPYQPDLPALPRPDCRTGGEKRPSRGCTATSATWRNSPRRMSPSPT